MGKRKNRSKRSTARPPKGLPTKDVANVNPFEVTHRQKRPKFHVHNRLYEPSLQATQTSKTRKTSALAVALQERRSELKQASKANVFSDQRIGIRNMTPEDATVARLVRERTRQSKRATQFQLGDNEDDVITHHGQPITKGSAAHFDPGHVVLDEDEQGTDLDETETSLHFGGGGAKSESAAYGHADLPSQYMSRKTELDEMILRRKVQKAERQQSKGDQVDAFSAMDGNFRELSRLLNFRDKDKAEMEHVEAKRAGRLNEDDQEMADWDMQMKQFSLATDKVKATDRTRTPEEIAKEEADRLHELETRRLARMQGDFDDDDLSDVDDGAEGLDDDSDKEDDVDPKPSTSIRFTADGLVRIDGDGNVVGPALDEEQAKAKCAAVRDNKPKASQKLHKVGTKVMASYCAQEQTDGNLSWFSGKIVKVDAARETYDVEYDDGDFEAGVLPEHISVLETAPESDKVEKSQTDDLKLKRRKATMKARAEMPFVFEVPSTLDDLNDLIGMHATTGEEASIVIQRIHKANSVRLNRLNADKMQNFYDILLRRFVAIGDAVHENGNGGVVGRYAQLDALTTTLYEMAQDSPDGATATWSRRLGFMHAAHLKRIRDAAFDQDESFSAWPSTGTFLALRLVGHIFPMTDKRHCITTPTILFLSQILVHTPVLSKQDLVMGVLCCGLLLEYTKGAKRIAPEALAFLDGTLRLISLARGGPLPTLEAAADVLKVELVSVMFTNGNYALSIEKAHWECQEVLSSVLYASLSLLESMIDNLSGSISDTESDVFLNLAEAVLRLPTKRFPKSMREKLSSIAEKLQFSPSRKPLHRQDVQKTQLKTLAPRIENTSVGRKNTKTEADRLRHELKREHKSTKRDIRLDASVVENERRQKESRDREKAQSKRQKAYAWMEQEQATINNQVRQGGGLLHGGGMGAAKAKAKSAKLGMKKGG